MLLTNLLILSSNDLILLVLFGSILKGDFNPKFEIYWKRLKDFRKELYHRAEELLIQICLYNQIAKAIEGMI